MPLDGILFVLSSMKSGYADLAESNRNRKAVACMEYAHLNFKRERSEKDVCAKISLKSTGGVLN